MHFTAIFRPSLTSREQQILLLVAQGLSAKETAQKLAIAPRTVERHIENTRLKLQARNRAHLIAKALECGALTAEPAPVMNPQYTMPWMR
jgi:LuxR family transcriptional regulator, transcriptional regulator of spore coat protein